MAQLTGITSNACRRIKGVVGDDNKRNDVIICGSLSSAKQHIIFFSGDTQDYKENMVRNNPAYDHWDLETTARILHSKFTDSAIFVMKPAKMFLTVFALYKNFLPFDLDAKPKFSENTGAFIHLCRLYFNSIKAYLEEDSCQACGQNVPIKLVGFSKGCVVITQLMFELQWALEHKDLELAEFVRRITAVYWLDGGHNGGSKAYITDDETLQVICSWNKELFVHVTPYQVNDQFRKWIGSEERDFVQKMQNLNASIKVFEHFMDEPGCILNHFKVLTVMEV